MQSRLWRKVGVLLMLKGLSLVIGGLAVVLAALLALFTVSMRMKVRPVQDAVRRMNRATLNRRVMQTAGQPGAGASVIHHVGRTSGASYMTPIGAVESEDGFVVALPYGTNADWLKNVLAAGSTVLDFEGDTYEIDYLELVPAEEANVYFPVSSQRVHRLFGVDDFLLLRRAEAA